MPEYSAMLTTDPAPKIASIILNSLDAGESSIPLFCHFTQDVPSCVKGRDVTFLHAVCLSLLSCSAFLALSY